MCDLICSKTRHVCQEFVQYLCGQHGTSFRLAPPSGRRYGPLPRQREGRSDYGEHFKAKYGPTIAARANAEEDGREAELDEALDRFCGEWNLGTPEQARFEQEYLLAIGRRA